VILAAGSAGAWSATVAAGIARGVVIADARSPGEVGASAERPYGEVYEAEDADMLNLSTWGTRFDAQLAYEGTSPASGGDPPAQPGQELRTFQLRATAVERARRLAETLISRDTIKKVAIVVPEHGADFVLGASFISAVRVMRREFEVITYPPGRRDYGAEAERFIASGADAILFTGPGEESGEWLAALARRKVRPLILGTEELQPAGFHPATRALLEGTIFVGSDWEDRSPDVLDHLERRGEIAFDPGFRRGFRFGWLVGRSILEGAYTPTSLRVALESYAHVRQGGQFSRVLVGVERPAPAKPEEIVVPLYTVKNGEAVPLPGF
jgi:hypothetical protein